MCQMKVEQGNEEEVKAFLKMGMKIIFNLPYSEIVDFRLYVFQNKYNGNKLIGEGRLCA